MNESPMIHVSRDGQLLGMFEQQIATQCLLKDVLHADDLAWTDGLTEWIPLNELLGVEAQVPRLAAPHRH
jgi:hypothetical protein